MVGYLAQRYVIPFLKIGKRQNYAKYISVIADELIDELRLKYPDKKWLEHYSRMNHVSVSEVIRTAISNFIEGSQKNTRTVPYSF